MNPHFRTTKGGEEFKLGTEWYLIDDLFPSYHTKRNYTGNERNNIIRMIDPRVYMWLNRRHGHNRKYQFLIKPTDIWIPPTCPITGEVFNSYTFGEPGDNSPSLDRIDNQKDYVPDNIWVIRNDWNKLKCTYSHKELREFYFKRNADDMFNQCGRDVNYDDLIEEDDLWFRYENMVLHLELLAYLRYDKITPEKCVITKEIEPNLMGLIERGIFTTESYRQYFWDI